MRLCKLEISGFRGFSQRANFDLDASAVILVGANGQGKTSFFDAILWAITGRVPRLKDNDEHLVSMYSDTGEAQVTLILRDEKDGVVAIKRRFDGEQQHVHFERDGVAAQGAVASGRIIETLWPASGATQRPDSALTDALTRSVYLQQDLVREFIESDDEQTRFSVVSELCGAGRVTELQQQLERSRNAWTRSSTTQRSEFDELAARLAAAESQLERLHEPSDDGEGLGVVWDNWWNRVRDVGILLARKPDPGETDAASALDRVVRDVRARRRLSEQALDRVRALQQEIEENISRERPDVSAMREQLEGLQRNTESLRQKLAESRSRAAEERRRQVVQGERNQDLAALAQIALRHLDERCPVCDQEFDRELVESHLSGHISNAAETVPDSTAMSIDVESLARQLEDGDQAVAAIQRRIQEAEALQREVDLWEAQRDRQLVEIGVDAVPAGDVGAALRSLAETEHERSGSLRDLEAAGEALSLRIARASEAARRSEIERQVAHLRSQLVEQKGILEERQATGELASRVIEQLREVSLEVVGAQMDQIAPLLQRIYATADPHPAFRSVRLLSKIFRGKGRLTTEIGDLVDDKATAAPELVLSSSQMNALAVSIFLALNLGVPSIPLTTAMLDDPLQSLDDVNLLGLIDLLRRLISRRQLIVSTHDARFGKLLQRKLRPVTNDQRTRVIEIGSWGRGGPTYRSFDLERDTGGLRIVAA